eukprot:861460_1
MYCVVIIMHGVATIVLDVIDVRSNTLHTKSPLYHDLLRQQGQQTAKIQNKTQKEPLLLNCFRKVRKWYDRYLAMDTTGWIMVMFIHEFLEIILQSQALFQYNGYYVLDPSNEKDIYLANKREYIIAFASILAFNCFASGLCWASYSLAHHKCHGLLFKFSIFFVDQFSDLFYTVFPFIVTFTDSYNKNRTNILILLGQLNVESGLAFIAAFIPLVFLCNKCFFITINSVRRMRDDYFNQWKFIQDLLRQPNDQLIVYEAQIRGLKTDKQFMDSLMQKEIYDANGNIQLNVKQGTHRGSKLLKNWIDKDKRKMNSRFKQISLLIMSLLYIVSGALCLMYTIQYLDQSEEYCSQIQEDKFFNRNGTLKLNLTMSEQEQHLLATNPELFAWHRCLYPVYPFASNQYKCQCRVFAIDWGTDFTSAAHDRHDHLKITQTMILQGALTNWIMLEKFKTVDLEKALIKDATITSDMFKARKMKAFEWHNAQIIAFEDGIGGWTELEYFRLHKTTTLLTLPSDFDQLKKMKYFRAENSGLVEFPDQLCSLTQLFGIHIAWAGVPSIPHCVVDLLNLQIVIFDALPQLTYIPIGLFSLPKLRELSIWKAGITYDTLLQFNNISATDQIETYFDEHFNWHTSTDYYISLNEICDEMYVLPSKLQQFINETNACHYQCSRDPTKSWSTLCPSNAWGDGICDMVCNTNLCDYDGGDCVQLCFAKSFSNCTWDLFTNEVCDKECDNQYCVGYKSGSAFTIPNSIGRVVDGTTVHYIGDNHRCIMNNRTAKYAFTDSPYQSISNVSCPDSLAYNEYKDVFFDGTQLEMVKCEDFWIGDGICDDSCRTESCHNDNGDCELLCIDDICSMLYTLWSYLNPTGEALVHSERVCSEFWVTAHTILEIEDNIDCWQLVTDVDYNQDLYINFREFVVLSLSVHSSDWQLEKAPQANCSWCVGMDSYNVKFEEPI